jgi:hypothetical protein
MKAEIAAIQTAAEQLKITNSQLAAAQSAHDQTAVHVAAAIPLAEEITALTKTIEDLLGANREAAWSIRQHLDNAIGHLRQAGLPEATSSDPENPHTLLANLDATATRIEKNATKAENTGPPMGFAPEYYGERLDALGSCQEILGKIATDYDEATRHNAASLEAIGQVLAPWQEL